MSSLTNTTTAQDIAQIEADIAAAQILQSGVTIGKDGEILGTNAEIQAELAKRKKLFKLENAKEALLHPEPPEPEEQALEDAPSTPRNAAKTLSLLGYGIRGAGSQMGRYTGSLPMPGSIWTPFFLLLFTWIMLIPVNGHTRFGWMWLTLTHNAFIGISGQNPDVNAPPIGAAILGLTSGNGGGSGPAPVGSGLGSGISGTGSGGVGFQPPFQLPSIPTQPTLPQGVTDNPSPTVTPLSVPYFSLGVIYE